MEVTGHAATGAAGGALVGLIPGLITNNVALGIFIVGCAGMALTPDSDHPSATFARTFGPFSKLLARIIEKISGWIYVATKTRRDVNRHGGHRTFTHTFLFCVIIGLSTLLSNKLAALIIVFIALCLGIHGFFPKIMRRAKRKLLPRFFTKIFPRSSSKVFLYTVAAIIPMMMYTNALPMLSSLQLSIMIGWGAAVHNIGDCLTDSGAPLFYPLPIRGQVWYRFKFPARFNTGTDLGKIIETWIKRACFVTIVLVFYVRWYFNK